MADARRAELLAAKLAALVAEGWPGAAPQRRALPVGAAGVDGDRAWVLVDERRIDADPLDAASDSGPSLPSGWLGGAVVWASRQGVRELHVIADTMEPSDARRAAVVRLPQVSLWRSVGRRLDPVTATGPQAATPLDPRLLSLVPTIEAAGAEAVVEHGVLRAEVLGLEVATAELDADGQPHLVVGVGRHDRLAQATMHPGDGPVTGSLTDAVGAVRTWRTPSAAPHAANQLARSRWLRWVLLRHPGLVGAGALAPLEGLAHRTLKEAAPALMLGTTPEGAPLVVAASVGPDLDAPIEAAVVARTAVPGAAVVLAVAPADALAALAVLAGAVAPPVEIRTVPADWVELTA